MTSVLVVDDDPDVTAFIESSLRVEGFDVLVAHDGAQALTMISAGVPDLALVDVLMPRIDGIEVVKRLRSAASTASLPVILMTSRSLPIDKIVGLSAGADDHIVKPFDTLELIARVRSTLRRNADMRAVSPLTGLPGNNRINEEIEARSNAKTQFAVCHVDLDNFKSFNDRYGWIRGDEVIGLLSSTLKLAAVAVSPPLPFIGHVGGDDFVMVCAAPQVEALCHEVINRFDAAVVALHEPEDVRRGFLSVVDRQGTERHYPLTSVSIGVATTERRHYADYREVVTVANEMKSVAKSRPGSAVAIDRRTDDQPAPAT